MRIALVGPVSIELLGGISWHEQPVPRSHGFGLNADLVNGLIARGHFVDVFTLSPGSKDLVYAAGDRLRLWAVPTRGRMSALRFYRSERTALARCIRDSGPHDLIHAHWLYEYALVAVSLAVPTLVTIHDWPAYVFRNDPSLLRFVKLMLSKVVIPRVTFASAPSKYMADVARHVLGIKSVEVVANALPASLLLDEHRPKDQPTEPVLVAINHGFSPRKNVSTLIKAMPLVRRDVPNARLRLIGSDYGPGEAAATFAARKSCADGIEFLGRLGREDVLRELTAAAAFVHPSKEESFGLVLAEAMARQTPVIAGRNAGAVPWILEDGRSGALCDIESPEDLAATIIGVLSSVDRRIQYAENGLHRVKTSFMMDQMVTHFEEIYGRVARAN